MAKLQLTQPTLFLLYGYPGAGKTFFARQISEDLRVAHLQADRIRSELFDQPRYDRQEDQIVTQLMNYMSEEFLGLDAGVVYDVNSLRASQRRQVRDLARKHKAQTLIVWFQLDEETAFTRVAKRNKRKIDDKYSRPLDRTSFDALITYMQNPTPTEDFVVVSGKHTYQTQRSAVIKKLYDMGMLHADQAQAGMAKPELVNLIPNPLAGRVDPSRRNIAIR